MSPILKNNTSKIVEIIGPPGVGKSTIFKSLCKEWNSDLNWIYQDALLAPSKPTLTNTGKWLEYNLRIILGKKRSGSIPVEYGMRFIRNNKAFANFCWNHLSDSKALLNWEIDNRFRSAHFLFNDFCRYQAIIEAENPRLCLIDEGFLQKSFLISGKEQSLPFLDEYLSLLPLPHSIVYIDLKDRNIITERLKNREKIIASHEGKDTIGLLDETENWQRTLLSVLDKLRSKHVRVYEINGEHSIPENVHTIKNILEEI